MILSVITSNPGKVIEFRRAMGNLGVGMEHLRMPYEEVQADTLEEVVGHALGQLRQRGMDNLVIDDSGLFIEALNGFPGVYSSYVLRTLGCQGVLRLMDGVRRRGAAFRCCIGAIIEGEEMIVCQEARGHIITSEKGEGGFGFDPIFQPEGHTRTYAEMSLEEKDLISHRGMAIMAFSALLRERMEVADGSE